MFEWLVKAAFAAAALWLVWTFLRSPYELEVTVASGVPRLRRGSATPVFLAAVAEACRDHGVTRGWVGGYRRGKRMCLRFSRGVPPGCQQRIRNVWQALG